MRNKNMRTINEIIIHCSDTQEGCDVRAKDIRRWHMTPKEKGGRGWSDIGYHYVIDLDGTIEVGRPFEKRGAHCIGDDGSDHNSHSIGICYIGGRRVRLDLPRGWEWADTRTKEQREAMYYLVKALLAAFPKAGVHGHREFAARACPCFDVQAWLREMNII